MRLDGEVGRYAPLYTIKYHRVVYVCIKFHLLHFTDVDIWVRGNFEKSDTNKSRCYLTVEWRPVPSSHRHDETPSFFSGIPHAFARRKYLHYILLLHFNFYLKNILIAKTLKITFSRNATKNKSFPLITILRHKECFAFFNRLFYCLSSFMYYT